MTRNSVFVSYCHEGMDVNTLEAFLFLLGDQLGAEWHLVHDRKLRPGDHLDELMALLDSVDAVILLLSPSYARKVKERQGGVYEEYAVIMDRYDAQREPESGGGEIDARNSFDLIPILFSGDESSAVPSELHRILYARFTDFRVPKRARSQAGLSPRRGEFVIPERLQRRFRGEFERISEKLATVKELRTPSFEQRFDDYLAKFFVNRKAKLSNPADVDRRQLGERFVKTKAFERLLGGNAYFVIGRKGSGKSTLAGVLASRDGRTKHRGAILVNAETLNLDLWYTTLMSAQPRSDMEHIFRNDRCWSSAAKCVLRSWVIA